MSYYCQLLPPNRFRNQLIRGLSFSNAEVKNNHCDDLDNLVKEAATRGVL